MDPTPDTTHQVGKGISPTRPDHPGTFTIALIGNPNAGKSSVFNQLTGLRQKTGNFPGVTVDKKQGVAKLNDRLKATILDLPGTYSLHPSSVDERIVVKTLTNPEDRNFPDLLLYVADATQLEKHLLLLSQALDLGLPIMLAINMVDVMREEGLLIDTKELSAKLAIPVVPISARTGEGMDQLKSEMAKLQSADRKQRSSFLQFSKDEQKVAGELRNSFPSLTDYQRLLLAQHHEWLPHLNAEQRKELAAKAGEVKGLGFQVRETMRRFEQIEPLVKATTHRKEAKEDSLTDRLDRFLTHRVFGVVFFIGLMTLVFQAIFAWAGIPMDWIDGGFAALTGLVQNALPDTWWRSLITDGILAGIGGVLIFIPQIAILFFLIAVLEESGYMARAVYLFDSLMRRFGLSGRSVVGLVSGAACAIPAIMSTRNISSWKERLITIMVVPLISCSARIPVYVVLIAFVVPAERSVGFFNAQGLVFMGLYALGIVAALLSAWVFKQILKSDNTDFLMLELPVYRRPQLRNIWLSVFEKTRTFVLEAGKIIFLISIVLWFLASYGPSKGMQAAQEKAEQTARADGLSEADAANLEAALLIEASYAGRLGKMIEPAIAPLGFDWKIGISLITSFAAREVFVSTMATIYSIGSDSDEKAVQEKLRDARDPHTGRIVYDWVTSLSLLIFYVFAMQCMSTLAVTKRETKSWTWTGVQFIFMTALAYLGSLFVYQTWG